MVSLETAALFHLNISQVLWSHCLCVMARDAQEPAVEGVGWVGDTSYILICM